MSAPRSEPVPSDALEQEPAAPTIAAEDESSIWDTLDDEDRASIERGLAQSLAGIHSTDEEVEAAFATFRR